MQTQDVTTIKIFDIQNNYTNNQLDFNPPCQRESGIWNSHKEYLLIDSIMKGYIIPPLYLLQKRHDGNTTYDVIDGSQRLHTILKFYGSQPINKDEDEDIQDTYVPNSHNIIEPTKLDFAANGISGYDNFKGYTIRELCESHYKSESILTTKFSNEERGYIRRLADFKFSVTYITKATEEELEDVFMRLNNGEALTIGERLNGLLARLPLWKITQLFAEEIEHDEDIYARTNHNKYYDEFNLKRKNDIFFWANVSLTLDDSLEKSEIIFTSGDKQFVFSRYENLYNYYCGKHFNQEKKSITKSEDQYISELTRDPNVSTDEDRNNMINEIKARAKNQRSEIDDKIKKIQEEEAVKADRVYNILKEVLPTFQKICSEIPADTKRGYVLYSLFLYSYHIVMRGQECRLNDNDSLYNQKIRAFFSCLTRPTNSNSNIVIDRNALEEEQLDNALEFRKNKSNDHNSRRKRFDTLKVAISL